MYLFQNQFHKYSLIPSIDCVLCTIVTVYVYFVDEYHDFDKFVVKLHMNCDRNENVN